MLRSNLRLLSLVLPLSFLFQAQGNASCGQFKIRYRYAQELIEEFKLGCAQQSPQGWLFTSRSCASSCPMKTTLRKTMIPDSQVFRQTGSPHFQVCHIMGWQPKILEVEIESKWKKMSICEDPSSGEFLDANSLLKIVLRK